MEYEQTNNETLASQLIEIRGENVRLKKHNQDLSQLISELQKQLNQLGDITKYIDEGIGIVDWKLRFFFSNGNADRIFGFPEGGLLNRYLQEVASVDSSHQITEKINEIRNGITKASYLEVIPLHGTRQSVPTRIVPFSANGIDYSGVMFFFGSTLPDCYMNIGTLSKDEYRTTINAISDMIHMIDRDFKCVVHNAAVTDEVRKYNPGFTSLINLDLFHIFPFLPECVRDQYLRVFDTGVVLESEEWTSVYGVDRCTETRKIPITDEYGRVVRVLTIIRDITERKHAEQEMTRVLEERIRDRTEELEKTNIALKQQIDQRKRFEQELLKTRQLDSLGRLAGGIAHDFNNILMSISGFISVAKMTRQHDESLQNVLSKAESSINQAKNLTCQLLTFAKGGSPIKSIVPIGTVLMENISFAIRGSKLTCEYDIPDDLWQVEIDKMQISQVISSIVINAIDATLEDGRIQCKAENVMISNNQHHSLPDGRYVKISIKDTGSGIPENVLPHVFEPFFTTKLKASGLGLAISHSIIIKHAGYIGVESTVGTGSTFYFYLPALSDVPKRTESSILKIYPGTGRILLMDDEKLVRESVGMMLNRLGYDVKLAENGEQAISMYTEARQLGMPFDVVILDLTVAGGMGGDRTIKQLQKIDPSVQAIVSSGYSNDPILANYRAAGFVGLIAKPYSLIEISQTLHDLLSK